MGRDTHLKSYISSLSSRRDYSARPQRPIWGAMASVCCCDEFQVKRVLELDLLQLEEEKLSSL